MGDWQPIETAPRDGTEFLAWDSLARKFDVAYMWNIHKDRWIPYAVQTDGEYGPNSDQFGWDHANVTHWQPLPSPPSS